MFNAHSEPTMSAITRYRVIDGYIGCFEDIPDEKGKYVLYLDHEARVREREADLARARERVGAECIRAIEDRVSVLRGRMHTTHDDIRAGGLMDAREAIKRLMQAKATTPTDAGKEEGT